MFAETCIEYGNGIFPLGLGFLVDWIFARTSDCHFAPLPSLPSVNGRAGVIGRVAREHADSHVALFLSLKTQALAVQSSPWHLVLAPRAAN